MNSTLMGDTLISPSSIVYPIISEVFSKKVKMPPATYLLEAMRNSSHNTTTAVAEFIDNSIDAEADNVWISFDKKAFRMMVADDGNGMTDAQLVKAVALGYHEVDVALGKFGVGLNTGASHLGRTFSVYSKTETGPLFRVDHHTDEIIKSNDWEYPITNKLSDEERVLFTEMTQNSASGTLIVIDGIDKHFSSSPSVYQYGRTLIKNLGQLFRLFLPPQVAGKTEPDTDSVKHSRLRLYIDGDCVTGKDPLERHAPNTKVVASGTIETKYGNIEYTTTELDDVDVDVHNYIPNYHHQGFYVLREGREILAHDKTVFKDIWKSQHSTASHLRCELRYSKEMDSVILVNHDKVGIKEVNEHVMAKIADALKGFISQYKQNWRSRRSKSPNEAVAKVHDVVTKNLEINASQLNLPSQRKVRRKKGEKVVTPKDGTTQTDEGKSVESKSRTNGDVPREKISRFQVQHRDMTAAGPALDFEFGPNNTLVVIWNTSHPFVQRFITLIEEAPDETIKGLDNLAFAMASYWEQRVLEDGDNNAWNEKDTFLGVLGQNLRVVR